MVERLKNIITQSATTFAIEHFFFEDTSIYLRFFLRHGDPADYLRQPFSPARENRLNAFEVLLAEMSSEAHAQNVPFVLMEIPNFAQAGLVSSPNVPAGVDPYAFNIRLSKISAAYGIQFISGLDGFRGVSDASKFYFVVDGHMNGSGNLLMSRILVEQLTKGQEAALSGLNETQRQAVQEQRR